MIERVEACNAWLESITYQMNNVSTGDSAHCDLFETAYKMTYSEQSDKLAGPIALLKQCVPRLVLLCTFLSTVIKTDSSRVREGRLQKKRHKFSGGEPSPRLVWAN